MKLIRVKTSKKNDLFGFGQRNKLKKAAKETFNGKETRLFSVVMAEYDKDIKKFVDRWKSKFNRLSDRAIEVEDEWTGPLPSEFIRNLKNMEAFLFENIK